MIFLKKKKRKIERETIIMPDINIKINKIFNFVYKIL